MSAFEIRQPILDEVAGSRGKIADVEEECSDSGQDAHEH
jgi:hypothetical protein